MIMQQLIELYLQFQQTVKNQLANEDEVNKKIAEIHFIETVPSMMREMPWIQIKEQEVTEMCRMKSGHHDQCFFPIECNSEH